MHKVERTYAIIYIDWDGELINEKNYTNDKMISDYYKHSGFLQWNYYLIFPSDIVKDKKDDILNNSFYTRKYIIHRHDILAFIDTMFPVLDTNDIRTQVKLVKGDSWENVEKQVEVEYAKNNFHMIPSIYRNFNMLHVLGKLDELRAELIINKNKKVLYYTHLSDEFFLADKKFKLFLIGD